MRGALFQAVCGLSLSAALLAQSEPNDIVESANHERYSVRAYQAGRQDATMDIYMGRLIIESFGLPPLWYRNYGELLWQRYRIYLKTVAGCVVDEKIVGHRKGYNELSEAEIQRRFGSEVLENTLKEVQQRWKKTHPK